MIRMSSTSLAAGADPAADGDALVELLPPQAASMNAASTASVTVDASTPAAVARDPDLPIRFMALPLPSWSLAAPRPTYSTAARQPKGESEASRSPATK